MGLSFRDYLQNVLNARRNALRTTPSRARQRVLAQALPAGNFEN
jgi:hypothetical protein